MFFRMLWNEPMNQLICFSIITSQASQPLKLMLCVNFHLVILSNVIAWFSDCLRFCACIKEAWRKGVWERRISLNLYLLHTKWCLFSVGRNIFVMYMFPVLMEETYLVTLVLINTYLFSYSSTTYVNDLVRVLFLRILF